MSTTKETPRQGSETKDSLVPKKVKKSVVPRLKKSSIPLTSIRNLVKEELEGIFDSVLTKISPAKEICLVLDPTIVGPLTLIIPFQSLTDKNVDPAIHTIEDPAWNTNISTIIYLSRPRMDCMKKIAKQIQDLEKQGKKNFFLYMVPRKTLISEITLQKCGVYHLIQQPIGEFGLDVLPVDNDLLSMEIPYVYRELSMDSDNSSLYFIARTIMKVQSIYGLIPRIKYIGTNGLKVAQMISALRSKIKSNYSFPPNVQIGNLILFDRSVDMVTPFLTQLTYEGLIDEMYGINNNLLSLDFMKEKKKQEKRSKLPLNDDDEVFVQIRHKNFNAIGKQLHKEANVITELYDEKNKMQNSKVDIKVIKEFVVKLPALQQRHEDLGTHISMAQIMRDETSKSSFRKNLEIEQNILRGENEEGVLDYIEELIIKQESLPKVLRLICLLSAVNEGLTDKAFDSLRKELIHSYGYVIMMTLYNLEYCGFIKRREGRSNWPTVRKALQLIEEVDEEKPTSIAYVYSGYSPLSIRIIEKFGLSDAKDKWQELKNLFDLEIGEIVQSDHSDASTMAFFIGGVTYAEISAFRWLTQEKLLAAGKGVVATTKIINGNTFISSMFDSTE